VLLPALALVFVLLMGRARMEKTVPAPQGKPEVSYNRG